MSVGRYSQLDSGSYARESSHNNNGTHSQSSSYTSRDERNAPSSSLNKDSSDYTRDRHHSVSSSSHSQRSVSPHAHNNNDNNNDYKQNNNIRQIASSSSHRTSQTPQTPAQRRNLWGSRSVDLFEKIEAIGEGTYGEVYMARSKETGEIVALKKIRMESEKEGFPITAIREIKILKEIHHDNVIQLKEIVTSKATRENKGKASIYMVFEYMDHDLAGLLMSPNEFRPTAPQIKCYMKQLLEGLHHCHSKGVLHRDLKGSNLLISNKGQLKLADFGLARTFSETNNHYTNRVITLWYRPPELLLGAVQYGPAIDMWSAGCILAELLEGKPIFPGKHEIDQLELICNLCGTPSEENWTGVVKLPWFNMFKPTQIHKRNLREKFKHWDKHALDLVDKLLTLDPSKRLSALDALDHDYFWNDPMPCEPSQLPKYAIASHELQAKKRKQMQQQDKNKRMKMNGPPGPQGYPQGPPPPGGKSGGGPYPPPYQPPYDRPPNGSNPPHHRASYPPSHPSSQPPSHSSYPPSHAPSSSSQPPRGPPSSGPPPPGPGPSQSRSRSDQPSSRSGPPPIYRPPSDNRPPLPPPSGNRPPSNGPPPPRQGPPPSDRDRRPPPRDGRPYPPEN